MSRQRGAGSFVAAPSALIEVVAWATLAAGLAAIPPTLFGAAPAVSAARPPVAIATVATCGYLGSFTGPPLIGALAEMTTLTAALGLLVAAAVSTSLLARRALDPLSHARRRAPQKVVAPFAPEMRNETIAPHWGRLSLTSRDGASAQ